MDEGLVRYIRERLGEGYAEDHIRSVLLQHGHTPADIDDAFAHIHRSQAPRLLIPALLATLLIIGTVAFFLLKPSTTSPDLQQPGLEPRTPPAQEAPPSKDILAIAADLKSFTAEKTADETYYLTVETATKDAKTTADAILICSVNEDLAYKNYCLQELAQARREAAFCDVIGDAQQRDDCYLGLIFEGEDQYCAKLVLDQSKRVCELLGVEP